MILMSATLDFLVGIAPSVGIAIAAFVGVFLITALFGSDGGTLSSEFPWQACSLRATCGSQRWPA